MPQHHPPWKGRAWLTLGLILTSIIASAARAEETDPAKALKRARRNGAEMIQAGRFSQAVAYLRRATGQFPDDGELHRLRAAAALDRVIQLDNQLEMAQSRLAMLDEIRSTLTSANGAEFKDSAAIVDVAVTAAGDAYQKCRSMCAEAQSLLDEAVREAQTAVDKDSPASPGVSLAIWIDSYRIIEADDFRTVHLRLERIPREGGARSPFSPAEEKRADAVFDRKAVCRHALHLLSHWARPQPYAPLPYLTTTEWLQLTEPGDRESRLGWTRNWRFRDGNTNRVHEGEDQAARDEYEAARRMPLGDLETAAPEQIVALCEQAAKLDPHDEYGTTYALYVQVLPGDEERGKALLTQVASKEPGNALIPLERARQAAAHADYDAMVRELTAAAAASRFHRPLFSSLPREIRAPFLSAHRVWERLVEAGFGYDFIGRGAQSLARTAMSPSDKQRLNLLKARIGALLMQSDLPHDWVLGAKLRRDALGALARDPDLPPDLAARVQVELQQTRAAIAARPQPLLMTTLWQNRLLFTPLTDDDLLITGSFIIAHRGGGVAVGSSGGP